MRPLRRALPWIGAVSLGVATLATGCRHGHDVQNRDVRGDELAASGGTLSVSLRVQMTADGNKDRAVSEGETLRTNDALSLIVRVSQPAYLYVVHFAPDGSSNVLFPTNQHDMAPASCPLRLPARGRLLLLDPAGNEDIRVVASVKPLAVADRKLCESMRLPCPTDAAATPPRVAPCSDMQQRFVLRDVKVARDAGQGVASLRFPLRHTP